MKICHIGTLPLERMGRMTRDLIQYCKGIHVYYSIFSKNLPYADIYVLHCFKKYHRKFENFKRPHINAKIISFIHSSYPCMPCKDSDVVITQTEYWRWKLYRDHRINAKTIYSCIDQSELWADFYYISKDNDYKWFGHILRNDRGKYHRGWKRLIKNILKKVPDSRAYFISRKPVEINNSRIIYNKNIYDVNKLKALCNLSVAVYAHGSFEEIFPMAVLECMSVGLPIVYLHQSSMAEMIGPDQIACYTLKEVENKTIELLNNYELRKEYGIKAKERTRFFSKEETINSWNKLFLEVINNDTVTKI